MVKVEGYVILTDSDDFLRYELFLEKKEAEYIAKQIAKDIGDDYKSYKVVKAKIFTIT